MSGKRPEVPSPRWGTPRWGTLRRASRAQADGGRGERVLMARAVPLPSVSPGRGSGAVGKRGVLVRERGRTREGEPRTQRRTQRGAAQDAEGVPRKTAPRRPPATCL